MESLRSPRLGLIPAVLLLIALAGWRLWSGPANPLAYLADQQAARDQLQNLKAELVALLPGGRLLEGETNSLRASYTPPGALAPVEVLLFGTGTSPSADHTLAWDKRGYRTTRLPSTVPSASCRLLVRGDEKRFLLSFYLDGQVRLPDLDALRRRLVADRFAGRTAIWLVYVEALSARGCRDSSLATEAEQISKPIENWLASQSRAPR